MPSAPDTGPSPPVRLFGAGLIPLSTEFSAVKLGFSSVNVTESSSVAVSRAS